MDLEYKPIRRKNFDEEVDDYDRLKRSTKKESEFTKKSGRIKLEFDYEEDPYEPEK